MGYARYGHNYLRAGLLLLPPLFFGAFPPTRGIIHLSKSLVNTFIKKNTKMIIDKIAKVDPAIWTAAEFTLRISRFFVSGALTK